jgi:hypothetical protein
MDFKTFVVIVLKRLFVVLLDWPLNNHKIVLMIL